MILVEMLGDGIWVHFNVRKFSRVSLEVDLQVSLRGESAAADVAFKGSLTCMGSYVDL